MALIGTLPGNRTGLGELRRLRCLGARQRLSLTRCGCQGAMARKRKLSNARWFQSFPLPLKVMAIKSIGPV